MFSISNFLCLRWTQQRNVTISIPCFAGQDVSVVLRITDLSCFRGTQQLAITETMTLLAGQQIALALEFGNFCYLRGVYQRVIALAKPGHAIQEVSLVVNSCNSLCLGRGQLGLIANPDSRFAGQKVPPMLRGRYLLSL